MGVLSSRQRCRTRFAGDSRLFGLFRLFGIGSVLIATSVELAPTLAQEAPAELGPAGDAATADNSTVIYGRDFIDRYRSAVSVLDIIRRIPGGESFIQQNGEQSRGFSSNEDRVLINGKRISGKQNDSQSALGRITVDQVLRIEIIRGSSPDIKITSGQAILNVVLSGDAETGSGTWRAGMLWAEGGDLAFGGRVTYGDRIGKLDYFLSFRTLPHRGKVSQIDDRYDGAGLFTDRLDETIHEAGRYQEFSTNLTYGFDDGGVLRLNGLYARRRNDKIADGDLFKPGGAGALVPSGTSFRLDNEATPKWEIGGDYERQLGDAFTLKLLGIYAREDKSGTQREDYLIESGTIADDYRSLTSDLSTEAIGRTSLTWNVNDRHDLEFGTELAFNKLEADLQYFERIGGELIEIDLPGGQVTVDETRNESFVNHTWKVTEKLTLDSSLTAEYSKLGQNGVGIGRSRTFFYLKPSIDVRYNVTPLDQVQFVARHAVKQLDFGDFAASTNEDNKTFGGNTDLKPERSYEFDLSYEKRFANDAGRVKLTGKFTRYLGRIERVPLETDDGTLVSGNGNVGNGNYMLLALEGSFRMIALGLPDLVIEPEIKLRRHRIRDPFTGVTRPFARWNSSRLTLRFRHDIPGWGLSYGGGITRTGVERYFDIDENSRQRPGLSSNLFFEKQLLGGLIARLEGRNLLNPNRGRNRWLYADGVAGGLITSSEVRERRQGRTYALNIRGTF